MGLWPTTCGFFIVFLGIAWIGHRHRQGLHPKSRIKAKDLDEPGIILDFLVIPHYGPQPVDVIVFLGGIVWIGHRHRQGLHPKSRPESRDLDEPKIFLDFLVIPH